MPSIVVAVLRGGLPLPTANSDLSKSYRDCTEDRLYCNRRSQLSTLVYELTPLRRLDGLKPYGRNPPNLSVAVVQEVCGGFTGDQVCPYCKACQGRPDWACASRWTGKFVARRRRRRRAGARPSSCSWESGYTAWSRSKARTGHAHRPRSPDVDRGDSGAHFGEERRVRRSIGDGRKRDPEVHAHHPSLRRPWEGRVCEPLIAVDRVVAVGAALDRAVSPAPSSAVACRCVDRSGAYSRGSASDTSAGLLRKLFDVSL